MVRRHIRSDGSSIVTKSSASEFPSADETANLIREFEILSSLSIPGICRALELRDGEHGPVLVLEDAGTYTLSARVPHEGLPIADFLIIAEKVARRVEALHENRVLHGHLTPENIVLDEENEPTLVDFGAATRFSKERHAIQTPNIEGTLAYVAPEQTGRMSHTVDMRSDLYSLGATYYFMLAGHPPFTTDSTIELLHSIIALRPTPLSNVRSDLPQQLIVIIDKLLQKPMEERYQSAEALVADLNGLRTAVKTGKEADFKLGDIPDFALKRRLYGREDEKRRLVDAFEGVTKGGVAALLVTGASGTGKTSLIRELQGVSTDHKVRLVEGKFEQFRHDTRSGVSMAIREALRRILMESDERLLFWKKRLERAVGESGGLLLDELPELELILGKLSPVPPTSSEENRARMKASWLHVIQGLIIPEQPLVLFVDDLQWADAESIDLLIELVTNSTTSSLLLLGAWRDDEVSSSHPVSNLTSMLRESGVILHELRLHPMRVEDTQRMVLDALHCTTAEAGPLVDLIQERSQGNPLFAREYLTSLNEAGLLRYEANRATWHLDEVTDHPLRDNLGKLVSTRIRRLGPDSQRVLTLAACIGARFDIQTLALVSEREVADTLNALRPSIQVGLVQPVGNSTRRPVLAKADQEPTTSERSSLWCFAHDRVQEAAYDFLDDEGKARTHLYIGRLLLNSLNSTALRVRLIEVVQHFAKSLELLSDPPEKTRLMKLFLAAGLRAKRVAAHAAANTWLEIGRSLLPKDAWTTHYRATLDLYSEGAETARLHGDIETMESLVDAVIRYAHNALDQRRVEETRIRHLHTRDQHAAAVGSAVSALRLFGVRLSARPSPLAVLRELLTAIFLVRRRTLSDLANLPKMEDEEALAAIRIMMLAGSPAFIASPNLFIVFACRMTKLSLRHGNCAESTWGYSTLAIVLANVLGRTKEGWKLGSMALELMESFNARELTAKNYASFYGNVCQWNLPWRAGIAHLTKARRTATEVGDIEYGCILALVRSWYSLFLEPLDVAEEVQKECLAYCRPFRAEFETQAIQVILSTTRELRGVRNDECAVYFDKDALEALARRKSGVTLFFIHLCRGLRAYLLGDPADAVRHLRRARKHELSVLAALPYAEATFFLAAALLRCKSRGLSTLKYNELGKMRRRLKKWSKKSPINYLHKHLLVEAELAMVKGHGLTGLKGFEDASKSARSKGRILDAAIAIERSAHHAFALGLERTGWSMLRDAAVAFRSWGVCAKAELIEAKLRERPAQTTQTAQTQLHTTEPISIDASIVFRSTRAISQEMVLDKLVQDLVHLLLQHTAAQRGALLLERDGTLVVEACAAVDGTEAIFPVPVVLSDELPLSRGVISYVARTGDSVVLHDAAVDGMFVSDPYIARERTRSILCAPLLNQKKIVAVAYLENNLIANSFTPDRLEVVGILLSQAALSIRNARLYANLEHSNLELERYSQTLEHRVATRTQDLEQRNRELADALQKLRDTQEHLINQQKLASLGALTAGIAHELRNPLNFVVNFAQLSADVADDMADAIDAAKDALGSDESALVSESIALLRSNIEKIHEHGHRAEQIIGNMLMHSRSKPSQSEDVDLNALVGETIHLAEKGIRHIRQDVDLEIQINLDPSLGRVRVLPADLRRVLVNIVNNAIDSIEERYRTTPGQPGLLRVETEDLPEKVLIRLADNGTGIEPGTGHKVFEPFFTTKPPGKGTGLGLSISHDIVTRGHGGSLAVEHTPGGGATFVVTLPKFRPFNDDTSNVARN